MKVLCVNAGSSTLKLSLLDADNEVLVDEVIESTSVEKSAESLRKLLDRIETPDAVGHRVVHGGGEFDGPVRISKEVRDRLASFTDLAPLHQPPALAGIDLVGSVLPDVPAVACFDTAFHATLPPAAYTYALPEAWKPYGLRRFGFHGLSHAYASARAVEMLEDSDARLVVCHLGAGASLSAVRKKQCVDTTMGFTPLEGLVMASRSGSVDPGLLLWMQRHAGLSVDDLDDALNHQSGLKGLAGTPDMREVQARTDPDAKLALDVFLHRLRGCIGAMVASLGGVDALVFTAGIGEHSPEVRARTVQWLGFLGLELDPSLNAGAEPDCFIGPNVLVIKAREDLQIASEVREVLR